MAKKVEQLPAAANLDDTGLVVISEGGASKKISKSQMLSGVRQELTDGLATKITANADITAKTATKISYDEKGRVTGGTSATTADINPSANRNYLTDAQLLDVAGLDALYDLDGNLVIPTAGAGVKMKDDLGIDHVVNVDRDGQVINMTGFITAKNGKFYLRGSVYNGIGINYYPLAWSGKDSITRIMDYAVKLGINEIRYWAFDQLSPSDSPGNFHFLDYPLVDPNLLIGIATPDFEADFAGWSGNGISGGQFTRVSEAGNSRTGDYSIKLVAGAANFNNMETDDIPVTAGINYTVTLWYKRVSQSGFGPLLKIMKGSDGSQLLDGGLMEQGGDAAFNNGFVRKQVRFNTGVETAVSIMVQNFGGSVTFYFDDFFINPTGTPILASRESQFVMHDFIVDEARKRGIKLAPSFADNTTNYNTKLTYVNWANAIYGAGASTSFPYIGFFNNTFAKTLYKQVLAEFWNRKNTINGIYYKDDPTFKSAELGNELRVDRFSGEANANTANGANIALVSLPGGWTDEMSTYLKETIGIKQLVTYGSMAHAYEHVNGDAVFNGSGYGPDYRLMAALPHIGYLDYHLYPTQDAQGQGLYPLGENDIIGYGQKLLGAARPAPINRTAVGSVTSFVVVFNEATLPGDQLRIHLQFGTGQAGLPTITDSAGNTYTRTSVTNSNKDHHYDGPQTTGVSQFTVANFNSSTLTVKVDENSGRESKNNARSRIGLEAQLKDFIDAGLAYGKPSTLSETGLSRDINTRLNVHYPLQPRFGYFEALWKFWFDNGGGQVNVWSASIVGGGSYSWNLGERDGEAVTDNSDDTNINNLAMDWNNKFHHHEAKSAGDDDLRYADSELSLRGYDGDYQGTLQLGTAGEALSFGHLVYMDEFTGLWKKAGANISQAKYSRLAMCVLAASGTGKSIKVLTFGNIRADSLFATFTVGKPIFMSETAGVISQTKPTTSGAALRVIGYADSGDQVYFQPDNIFCSSFISTT